MGSYLPRDPHRPQHHHKSREHEDAADPAEDEPEVGARFPFGSRDARSWTCGIGFEFGHEVRHRRDEHQEVDDGRDTNELAFRSFPVHDEADDGCEHGQRVDRHPERIVDHVERFMDDRSRRWQIANEGREVY